MNIREKILRKLNPTMHKKIIHCDQITFILSMKGWLKTQQTITVIYHKNRPKKKIIKSIEAESFGKI